MWLANSNTDQVFIKTFIRQQMGYSWHQMLRKLMAWFSSDFAFAKTL
jgi:hypothetical protein